MRRLIIFMMLLCATVAAQNKIDGVNPPAPIAIEEAALNELREAANQAFIVRQAASVASKILIDTSSSCVAQTLAIFEAEALSRENRRDAMILTYRYKKQIPESYRLDLQNGQFVPPPPRQ